MIKFRLISILLLFTFIGACAPFQWKHPGSQIIHHSNFTDRTFSIHGGEIWERRWNGVINEWQWIEHAFLNQQIGSIAENAPALGPLLCNSTEATCALFVRHSLDDPLTSQTIELGQSGWLEYFFDPFETDYSNQSSPGVNGSQNTTIPCITNLAVDANWRLYCINVDDNGSPDRIDFRQLEVSLNLMNVGSVNGKAHLLHTIDTSACVMSGHDIFFLGENQELMHANVNAGLASHGRKMADVQSGTGMATQCFSINGDYELIGRKYDGNKWVWANHGRPLRRRNIDYYVLGSMRKMNDGKLFFLLDPDWGDTRLYERWGDKDAAPSGWSWADHSHPNNEVLVELGPAWGDTIFLLSKDGDLIQRVWNSSSSQWNWFNHGQP